jgi:hypothetical protein
MTPSTTPQTQRLAGIVPADHEAPLFQPGDQVRVFRRQPIGHYRVPTYLRGKLGTVQAVIEPCGVNNEEEGFGRNAGGPRHYYRVLTPMTELWPGYTGSPRDGLYIEVFETWLERA